MEAEKEPWETEPRPDDKQPADREASTAAHPSDGCVRPPRIAGRSAAAVSGSDLGGPKRENLSQAAEENWPTSTMLNYTHNMYLTCSYLLCLRFPVLQNWHPSSREAPWPEPGSHCPRSRQLERSPSPGGRWEPRCHLSTKAIGRSMKTGCLPGPAGIL